MAEFPIEVAVFPEQAGDPVAAANRGKAYTKDVAGVTQFFYEASDGTVTQLTPAGGGGTPNRMFIYDDTAVQAGNVYNDLLALLTAAQAVNGIKTIQMFPGAGAALATGVYNFQDCELIFGGTDPVSTQDALSFTIFAGSTVSHLPFRMQNIGLNYNASFPADDHGIMCTISVATTLIMEGSSRLSSSGPLAGVGGGMFQVDSTLQLYMRDNTYFQCDSGGATDFKMFRGTGAVKIGNTTAGSQSGLGLSCSAASFLGDSVSLFMYGPGTTQEASVFGAFTTGSVEYQRGSNIGASNADYLLSTAPLFAATQNDYNPTGLYDSDVIRIRSTGAQLITGFLADGINANIQQGYAQQVRKLINVGVSTITIGHNNGGSTAPNQVLCATGANILVTAGQWCWLWYDPITVKWRAKL